MLKPTGSGKPTRNRYVEKFRDDILPEVTASTLPICDPTGIFSNTRKAKNSLVNVGVTDADLVTEMKTLAEEVSSPSEANTER